MTTRAALSVVIAVAVAALVLTASSFAASPSAWAKSADAICAKHNKEVDKIPAPKTLEQLATSTEKLLAIGIREMNDIAALDRPAADKANIAKLLGYYGQQVAIVKRLIAAVKASDQKKMNAVVAEGNALDAKLKAVEKKLGAVGCAK
jgi:hypothetical protein